MTASGFVILFFFWLFIGQCWPQIAALHSGKRGYPSERVLKAWLCRFVNFMEQGVVKFVDVEMN